MSGILKGIGMALAGVLAVAAVVFTAGAALGVIPLLGGATTVGGAFAGAVTAGLGEIGITGGTLLGSVLGGAITSAGIGAAAGGAIAGVTGGDIGKGLEMGALTGAVTGGLSGGLSFDPLAPVNVTPATGSLASGAASNGAAGAADLSAVTVTPSPVSAGTAPATTAAATPGGAATAATATPTGAPEVASSGPAGVALRSLTPTPAAFNPGDFSTPNVPAAASGGGGLLSQAWDATADGQGGHGDFLGKVIGGIGQGLVTGQDATDAAKIGITRDQAARDSVSANYAAPTGANGSTPISGGGLIRPAANPAGLQKPAAAFNPTARWVLDPVQRRLVLVPATGTTFSTPTA